MAPLPNIKWLQECSMTNNNLYRQSYARCLRCQSYQSGSHFQLKNIKKRVNLNILVFCPGLSYDSWCSERFKEEKYFFMISISGVYFFILLLWWLRLSVAWTSFASFVKKLGVIFFHSTWMIFSALLKELIQIKVTDITVNSASHN